jgi:phenylalanyl-tRNA synthetase beta chain
MLVSNGFYEIWTNSLTNKAYQDRNKITFDSEPVEILNKLSEEQGILRQSMLFTGLEVCGYNINRRQKDVKVYEFGKTYFKTDGKYQEKERLALYITGNTESENWQNKTKAVSYYDIAQYVSQVLDKCGVKEFKQEELNDQLFDYGAKISVGNKELAKLGKVKSSLVKDFGIKQDLFYCELDSSLLFQLANPKLVIREVTKFPEVKRDLSLVLESPVRFEEIRNLILATEKKLVKNISAFDVYEGDKIPKGKKAYALSVTLQDENKTLTDEEIERTMSRLIAAFEQKLGAVIRK